MQTKHSLKCHDETELEAMFFNAWQVLSCRSEVQSELVQQVLLLMGNHKQLGMVEICEFLKPFLNYSILRIPFSDSLSSLFARHLISSMASFCCLFPLEAMTVFKLLTETLKYVPCKNSEASQFTYWQRIHLLDSFFICCFTANFRFYFNAISLRFCFVLLLLSFIYLETFQDSRNFIYFAECMVDAYIVVLRHWAETGLVSA